MEIVISLAVVLILVSLYVWITSPDEKWEIGDFLILNADSPQKSLLKECNIEYAKLVGWNNTHVFCEFTLNEKQFIRKIAIKEVYANKSAAWRNDFDKCKQIMGVEPDFFRGAKQGVYKEATTNTKENNNDIDSFNETECHVHLKLAIENDEFERAAKIRNRLEKHFR